MTVNYSKMTVKPLKKTAKNEIYLIEYVVFQSFTGIWAKIKGFSGIHFIHFSNLKH